MINDDVQRIQNPKNTKIEMRERERLPQNSMKEKQKSTEREREREECGFFFLEDSRV